MRRIKYQKKLSNKTMVINNKHQKNSKKKTMRRKIMKKRQIKRTVKKPHPKRQQ